MRTLKKSVHDAEMRLEQHRLDAHHQAQELQALFLQKISTPKVLLGGLTVGVLLGLLRGQRRPWMDKCRESGLATGRKPRQRGWLRTIRTLVRYAPIVSAAAKSVNTVLQQQQKAPAAP